jgi:predicted HicB family RNase H-like nuclease
MRYMKEKRDRITVGVPKGDKDKYKVHAESRGMSLNALIVELLEKDIKENP